MDWGCHSGQEVGVVRVVVVVKVVGVVGRNGWQGGQGGRVGHIDSPQQFLLAMSISSLDPDHNDYHTEISGGRVAEPHAFPW